MTREHDTPQQLHLMALEPLPAKDWLPITLAAASAAGLHAERRGQAIVAWEQTHKRQTYAYADGWELRRQWLGPRRHAVCLTAQRLYFELETGALDVRQEHDIVKGKRPPSPSAVEQLHRQWEVLSALIEHLSRETCCPVRLDVVRDDLTELRVISIAGTDRPEPNGSIGSLYRALGFDSVPDRFTLSLCCADGVPTAVAREYSHRIQSAAESAGVVLHVSNFSYEAIRTRLAQLQESGGVPQHGRCLMFLMRPKNEPHDPETLELMRALERAGVAFRRAYSSDPFEYSAASQLPSILMAAGGRAHRACAGVNGSDIWTAGIDLGHPKGGDASRLVLTLVDPEGSLAGAWFVHQRRDETARIGSLTGLLERCSKKLLGLTSDARVMVLRDGRMFENERAHVFAPYFPQGFTLVEFRKGHNPQMVFSRPEPHLPGEPLAACVPGTSTTFITTIGPRGAAMLPPVAKIVARPEANGLRLSSSEIVEVITRSAAAPSLGPLPHHLPAAIYWADGIAGKSDTDLRFWGVPAVCVD